MRSEDEMVAYALEAPTALLRYLPELLADLEELGSDAEAIAGAIDDLDPTISTTVVDLGCGKGAVAVEVAEKLNLKVCGIDLFEPFMESCKELAESRGGDVLGALDQTVSVIRQYVKTGGYIVISDGFIKDGGSSDFAGFEQYADHDTMIARLTACGDTLLHEIIEVDICDGNEGELITARAKAIATRRPEIAADVLNYAETQVAEYEYIEGNFVSAIWVLKRTQ